MPKKQPKKPKPVKMSVGDEWLAALVAEAERLDNLTEGDEVSHTLDGVVVDFKLAEAEQINTGGYVRQLKYLVDNGVASGASEALKGLAEELDTDHKKEEGEKCNC